MTEIRRALLTERAAVLATLAEAFFDDPMHAWLFEDDGRRAEHLPGWFGCLLDLMPDGGQAYVSADCSSAAIWHPPAADGAASHEAEQDGDELPPVARFVVDALGTDAGLAKLARMAPLLERRPAESHWYLALLGSNRAARGKGQGSALLHAQLAQCDADGVAAYLESSNPQNVPFYTRHGFEPVDELDLDEGGPTITFMWRTPR